MELSAMGPGNSKNFMNMAITTKKHNRGTEYEFKVHFDPKTDKVKKIENVTPPWRESVKEGFEKSAIQKALKNNGYNLRQSDVKIGVKKKSGNTILYYLNGVVIGSNDYNYDELIKRATAAIKKDPEEYGLKESVNEAGAKAELEKLENELYNMIKSKTRDSQLVGKHIEYKRKGGKRNLGDIAKGVTESVNESFDHNKVMDMLDIAAQYSSTQHHAANQDWKDAQTLYSYLKSDHIPKKYHKDFYKDVKRNYKVNERFNIQKGVNYAHEFEIKDPSNKNLYKELSKNKVEFGTSNGKLLISFDTQKEKETAIGVLHKFGIKESINEISFDTEGIYNYIKDDLEDLKGDSIANTTTIMKIKKHIAKAQAKGYLPKNAAMNIASLLGKDPRDRQTIGAIQMAVDDSPYIMENENMKKSEFRALVKEIIGEVLTEKDWIKGVEKDIEKRGTEGVCTGAKFGSESCKPGTKRYNLAKTFRAMAKKRKKG